MPELPDVAGFMQYLDATALHQRIARTHVLDDRLLDGISAQRIQSRLKGAAMTATARRGKFLLAELTSRGFLVLHFGMTGEPAYYKGDDRPEYARVVLDFENHYHLAVISRRMLGRVTLTDDVEAFAQGRDLGPDALDPSLTAKRFLTLLADRRGAIKSTLMDQSVISGVGNVYSDEILFQAGVRPATKVDTLSDDDRKEIYRALRRVLKVAANKGGDIHKLPNGYLLPVRDAGASCPRCDGALRSVTVSGRTGYYCPTCQPKR